MAKKIALFLLMFIFFSTIYGGMNYYFYYNLVQGLSITGRLLIITRIVFWLLGISYILGMIFKSSNRFKFLLNLGAIWMGILSISLTVFLIIDLAELILRPRRNIYIFSLFSIILLIVIALINGYKEPEVKVVRIKNKKRNKIPLNIVHLSDIHLGIFKSTKWLSGVIEKVNSFKPDIVLITGDMIDDTYEMLKDYIPVMKKIETKQGVFAIVGNHDQYSGIQDLKNFCIKSNIYLLSNESLKIEGNINLIGLDDERIVREEDFKNKLKKSLNNCDLDLYNILLIHQPVGFEIATKMGIDLQLSGHTHKGQLPPLSFIIPLFYKYSYGLYTYEGSHIYTTSGTGTWGPPMRLFSKSEIVNIIVN